MEESAVSITEESPKCRARKVVAGERSSPQDFDSLMSPAPPLEAAHTPPCESFQDAVPDAGAEHFDAEQPTASAPAVLQPTISDSCQQAIDEANSKVGDMKFRDIQKDLKVCTVT